MTCKGTLNYSLLSVKCTLQIFVRRVIFAKKNNCYMLIQRA